MNHTNLETLFNPKTVCVIGASQKRNKVGSQVLVNLITASFTGKIYPINPKHDMLFGLKTYKSIKDIVESIDLAVVTIPNSQVPSVIEECVEENVKFAVIITAGFGEMEAYDPGGVTLRTELLQILKRGSLRVVGPNCMGLVSTSSNLLALMGFGIPPARKKINASIVSQSGTWGITTIRAGTVQG
ncbi:MAG: CoA-binding protein, partial [Candidatus Helarchaeota archaeon]